MNEPLDLQIQQQLGRFVDGSIPLDVFEEWFVEHSWNVHQMNNTAANELVNEIEALLAQLSEGSQTTDRLRQAFARLALQAPTVVPFR